MRDYTSAITLRVIRKQFLEEKLDLLNLHADAAEFAETLRAYYKVCTELDALRDLQKEFAS